MMASLLAPAKINLNLAVGSPLADGRHPLDSVVAFTQTLGDTLTLGPASDLSLQIDGPFGEGLSGGADNLVLRAARLLGAHMRVTPCATIKLTKNLPIASGIGGGSSDAAAALIGLNDLWAGGLSAQALQKLGEELGADVPACVAAISLRMTGTGEITHPIGGLPPLGIVLVNPLIACPTGPVFSRFDELGEAKALSTAPLPSLVTQDDLLSYLTTNFNDLEPAAISRVPEIATILGAIAKSPSALLSRMSGSGATCFGLYPNLATAQAAAIHLKKHLAMGAVWVEADAIRP
jgi:4-diphosphocytidyl-2-C-methyl-D-erythritol kinase